MEWSFQHEGLYALIWLKNAFFGFNCLSYNFLGQDSDVVFFRVVKMVGQNCLLHDVAFVPSFYPTSCDHFLVFRGKQMYGGIVTQDLPYSWLKLLFFLLSHLLNPVRFLFQHSLKVLSDYWFIFGFCWSFVVGLFHALFSLLSFLQHFCVYLLKFLVAFELIIKLHNVI